MRLLHFAIIAATTLATGTIAAQADFEVSMESVRELTVAEYNELPNNLKMEVVPQVLRNIIGIYKQKRETRVKAYCMGDLDRIMERSGESKLERISRERLDLAIKEFALADTVQSVLFEFTENECNPARLQAQNEPPKKRKPTPEEIEMAKNNKVDFLLPVSKKSRSANSQPARKEETEEERRKRIGQNKIDLRLPVTRDRQTSQRSRGSPNPRTSKATGPQIVLPRGMKLSGDAIRVTITDLPGNPQDWVTLVPASAPLSTFGEWHYTKGLKKGTWSFVPRESGRYEIRVYYDWPTGGYDVKARMGFDVQ